MIPKYETLKENHYSSDEENAYYVDKYALYEELGYDYDVLYKESRDYENTCATRMSLALIKTGVPFHGRLKIKDGPFKGQTFEPGAKLLADQLMLPTAFGKPVLLKPEAAASELNNKQGVAFFWKIAGYGGGHMDLIETFESVQVCHSHCYFNCKEVWFWPLP